MSGFGAAVSRVAQSQDMKRHLNVTFDEAFKGAEARDVRVPGRGESRRSP